MKALSPKQQAFVVHYAACGNATEAARQAGYSKRYAGQNADKLLKNTNVQAALAALTEKVASERIATATERQEFWTAVMRADKNQGFAEAELRDRLKASEHLGKAQLDFIDRKELTGKDGAPLIAPDVTLVFVNALPVVD